MSNLAEEVEAVIREWQSPPRVLHTISPTSHWFATVSLGDTGIVWSVIRELDITTLTAAPRFAPDDEFDYDLLWRLIFGRGVESRSIGGKSVADLLAIIPKLSKDLQGRFTQAEWPATKQQLLQLYRHRDAERFGRSF